MREKTIAAGVFPDVAATNGRTWLIARIGDPRAAGHVAIFLWEGSRVDQARELWRVAVAAGSPAFPRIYHYRGEIWFAYHDGSVGHLRNATTSDVMILAPCQNNDPICFGGDYVAWQGSAGDGWPITRMHLRTQNKTAAGFGQGTGLSRVLDDGRVVLVDTDRQVVPGGTRPSWAGDLVVIEKHGNRGALARLTDGREAFLWPDVQIITPRCAFDAALGGLFHVAGWSESDGQIRAATLTSADFVRPDVPVPPPNNPPPQPPPGGPMAVPDRSQFARDFLGPRLGIVGSEDDTRAKSFDAVNAGCLELRKTDPRWGLLEKTSGAHVRDRAADVWLYNTGNGQAQVVDVVGNAEGAPDDDGEPRKPPFVAWGLKDIRPISQWKEPYPVGGTPPPQDPPPPDQPPANPPPVDLSGVYQRLDAIDRKLDTLTKPRTYAVKSDHGYLSVQGDGSLQWNRQQVGGWERLRVEPQE